MKYVGGPLDGDEVGHGAPDEVICRCTSGDYRYFHLVGHREYVVFSGEDADVKYRKGEDGDYHVVK